MERLDYVKQEENRECFIRVSKNGVLFIRDFPDCLISHKTITIQKN